MNIYVYHHQTFIMPGESHLSALYLLRRTGEEQIFDQSQSSGGSVARRIRATLYDI